MRRLVELDALRGLAALSIVFYHVIPWRFPYGWVSVDCFFVISGYLITSIILKNAPNKGFLPVFYARRALRIWPLYYASLFAMVALNYVVPTPDSLDGLPYYLTYTQNIHRYWFAETPAFLDHFSHTWTLAIEEQFYIIWPPLVCLAGRKYILPLCLFFAAIPVAARALGLHWSLLFTRCDGFALGALLAALLLNLEQVRSNPGKLRNALVAVGASSFGYLLMVALYGDFTQGTGLTWPAITILMVEVFFFSVLGLVLCHLGHPLLGPLRMRWLCYIGTISYGLYFYHFFLCRLARYVDRIFALDRPWWLPVSILVASVLLASLSWELFEKPVLRLKDRFSYHPRILSRAAGEGAERERTSIAVTAAG